MSTIAPFVLHRPETLSEALSLLAYFKEDARILAGGSELSLLLKLKLARPRHIVDIKRIPSLDRLDFDPAAAILHIGCLVTHRAVEKSEMVRGHFPLLVEMEKQVANVRIRNVGTVAGNLCFAEPHADPGTLLVALEASVKVRSAEREERTLKIGDFFVDYYTTALADGELLTGIDIPKPAKKFDGVYLRFCPGERPIAGAALLIAWKDGACEEARLALGCVAPAPVRASELEAAMKEKSRAEILARAGEFADKAASLCQPLEDVWGSVEYKRQIVRTQVLRGLSRLCARSVADG